MNTSGNKFKLTLFSFFFVFAMNVSFSQMQIPTSFETGTISTTYCVSIDTSKPLVDYYQIDISHLNFATATDAQKVFGSISNNRLSYGVDFDNQVAYLLIHADRVPEPKDVIWWNDYINSLCAN